MYNQFGGREIAEFGRAAEPERWQRGGGNAGKPPPPLTRVAITGASPIASHCFSRPHSPGALRRSGSSVARARAALLRPGHSAATSLSGRQCLQLDERVVCHNCRRQRRRQPAAAAACNRPPERKAAAAASAADQRPSCSTWEKCCSTLITPSRRGAWRRPAGPTPRPPSRRRCWNCLAMHPPTASKACWTAGAGAAWWSRWSAARSAAPSSTSSSARPAVSRGGGGGGQGWEKEGLPGSGLQLGASQGGAQSPVDSTPPQPTTPPGLQLDYATFAELYADIFQPVQLMIQQQQHLVAAGGCWPAAAACSCLPAGGPAAPAWPACILDSLARWLACAGVPTYLLSNVSALHMDDARRRHPFLASFAGLCLSFEARCSLVLLGKRSAAPCADGAMRTPRERHPPATRQLHPCAPPNAHAGPQLQAGAGNIRSCRGASRPCRRRPAVHRRPR